jgi:hypothetical protein
MRTLRRFKEHQFEINLHEERMTTTNGNDIKRDFELQRQLSVEHSQCPEHQSLGSFSRVLTKNFSVNVSMPHAYSGEPQNLQPFLSHPVCLFFEVLLSWFDLHSLSRTVQSHKWRVSIKAEPDQATADCVPYGSVSTDCTIVCSQRYFNPQSVFRIRRFSVPRQSNFMKKFNKSTKFMKREGS